MYWLSTLHIAACRKRCQYSNPAGKAKAAANVAISSLSNAPTTAVGHHTTSHFVAECTRYSTILHCTVHSTDLAQSLTDFNLFAIKNAPCAIFQCIQFWVRCVTFVQR